MVEPLITWAKKPSLANRRLALTVCAIARSSACSTRWVRGFANPQWRLPAHPEVRIPLRRQGADGRMSSGWIVRSCGKRRPRLPKLLEPAAQRAGCMKWKMPGIARHFLPAGLPEHRSQRFLPVAAATFGIASAVREEVSMAAALSRSGRPDQNCRHPSRGQPVCDDQRRPSLAAFSRLDWIASRFSNPAPRWLRQRSGSADLSAKRAQSQHVAFRRPDSFSPRSPTFDS